MDVMNRRPRCFRWGPGCSGSRVILVMWGLRSAGAQGPRVILRVGPQGPAWCSGSKGDTGDMGPQGPAGAQGLEG